jgi:hypothetical protein
MAFDVIIGRAKHDVEKYGKRGTIFIGKQYVKMGEVTTLSNPVYLDVATSHVMFVCGKRGGGKSYSMGVIAEGIADLPKEVRDNLSIILLDTMGVFWTMKYPNNKDAELLTSWDLEPRGLDVKIYTPAGFYQREKEEGIPTDMPFSLRPADIDPEDWCLTFSLDVNSAAGVLISRVVNDLRKTGKNYSLTDMIASVKEEDEFTEITKNIVINQFRKTMAWGMFSTEGTPFTELAQKGQVTIIDMGAYATLGAGWAIKALVVGLICRKLFAQRMLARKAEEFSTIDAAMHYFTKEEEAMEEPMVWLALDEAHELLPSQGKTAATDALITLLREGRQPGISLILASQQPGKIHTDVMTQSDIVLSHRLTAKIDVDALGQITQSYLREGLPEQLEMLPPVKGSAVLFDDSNERIFPIQVRPRLTWHGGAAPIAVKEKKEYLRKLEAIEEM